MQRARLLLIAVAVIVAACTPASETPSTVDTSSTTSEASTTTSDIATTTTEYTGQSYAGTVDAPDFPSGFEWVNTSTEISLEDLRGKVVLLDFWTYGCINCIQIIPDLERLEAEFPDELVVIGVHSAKFPNEGETTNLRDIVQRYDIRHPVVNDKSFAIWTTWGVNGWPTVAVIDPDGRAVGIRSGEGVYDAVEPVIAGLVAEFDAKGSLDREPITFALEADVSPERPLDYPGKVLALGGEVWIADTGHDRVVRANASTGDVIAVYGGGTRGSDDGPALEATFDAPQGLAAGDGGVFVADTGNHLVRRIDVDSGEVTTVVGSGTKGWPPLPGALRTVDLASPWAVAFTDGVLYIANAGTHQIWRADLESDAAGPYIGSAAEGTVNGPFVVAELAQPSSLTLVDDRLYFADSESSAIRVGDMSIEQTDLVVGSDAGLFDFGDVDGVGGDARLQHPLGTAADGDTLFIADTYNSKIKRVDLTTRTVTTWLGSEAGFADGSDPLFNEPGGLSIADGILYVADTNNHAIRQVDLASGATTTLILKGIEDFDPPAAYRGEVVTLPVQPVSAGEASLVLDYSLPDGYKVNEEAPSSVEISSGTAVASLGTGSSVDLTGTTLPVSLPLELHEGTGTVRFDVTIIYCEAVTSSLCLIDQVRYEVPLEVGPPGASSRIVLERSIGEPGT